MYLNMYLSLGSNIEPREEYLKKAINELKKHFIIKNISSIYETEPLEDKDQNYFLNLCVHCLTNIFDPLENLKICKNIEEKIGRQKDKNRPKGPRKIDIDIIFLGDLNYSSRELTIPHKSFLKRNFVIVPLYDIIEGSLKNKYNFKKLISENKNQSIRKIGELKIG